MKGEPMNTVLLATDGSSSAMLATEEAVRLASATGWALRIVTVWDTPIPVGYGFPSMPLPVELRELERTHAREVAEAAVTKAAAAGVDATFELREGMPGEEILAAAAEAKATVVVLGAHGWGSFKRMLFGSVSTRVMHGARCPVLVAREEEAAQRQRVRTAA
jgi:nucleotide-binding universal stress UspA family protein